MMRESRYDPLQNAVCGGGVGNKRARKFIPLGSITDSIEYRCRKLRSKKEMTVWVELIQGYRLSAEGGWAKRGSKGVPSRLLRNATRSLISSSLSFRGASTSS